MTDDELKITAKFEKERKKVLSQKRKCLHPFCKKNAIDSHVLQKNGFISQISEDNHVYEHIYYSFKRTFIFKRTGVNEVFTFKGFCSYHDDRLFKEIESRVLDFNDYKTNLIFAYRIISQEIIKKTQTIELDISLLNKKIGHPIYLKESINGERLGIEDANYTLKLILKNIANPSLKNFNFHTREIKHLDICASGIYTYETSLEQSLMSEEVYSKPLTDIFINILPLNSFTSIVTIGYLNSNNLDCNSYINSKFSLPENEFIKFLSDILIAQMENWIISPSFYERIKKDETILADLTKESMRNPNERFSIEYNLFV